MTNGSVWSNPLLAGAVPGAGPGLRSNIPGAVPVPSVSAGGFAPVGVPPEQVSSTAGTSGVGGTFAGVAPLAAAARAFARSGGDPLE